MKILRWIINISIVLAILSFIFSIFMFDSVKSSRELYIDHKNKMPLADINGLYLSDRGIYCFSERCSNIICYDFNGNQLFNIIVPERENDSTSVYTYDNRLCFLGKDDILYILDDQDNIVKVLKDYDNKKVTIVSGDEKKNINMDPYKYMPVYYSEDKYIVGDEKYLYEAENGNLKKIKKYDRWDMIYENFPKEAENEFVKCKVYGIKTKLFIEDKCGNQKIITDSILDWMRISTIPFISIVFILIFLIIVDLKIYSSTDKALDKKSN